MLSGFQHHSFLLFVNSVCRKKGKACPFSLTIPYLLCGQNQRATTITINNMVQADGVTPQEPQLVQAVRSVNKDQALSSIAPVQPDDIFYVDCHTDPETQKPIILWDDILQAFVNAVQVRNKARVVPFLKGLDLRKYICVNMASNARNGREREPLC